MSNTTDYTRCANPQCQHWHLSHVRAGCVVLGCKCGKFEKGESK